MTFAWPSPSNPVQNGTTRKNSIFSQHVVDFVSKSREEAWTTTNLNSLYLLIVFLDAGNLFFQVFFTVLYSDLGEFEWMIWMNMIYWYIVTINTNLS